MKIYDYSGKKNISGERIRECRVRQRMSQEVLAAKLQIEGIIIERNSISRIETGARFVTDYEINALAHIFNTPIEWFFQRQN